MVEYRRLMHRAQRCLAAVGSFVRAARPRLSSGESQLGKEFDVARLFVAHVARARRQDVGLDLRLPEALRAQRFPSGLLLPLLRSALAAERLPSRGLLLEARQQAERVRVHLKTPFAIDALDVDDACALITTLHGASARVLRKTRRAGDVVTIDIPRED